MRTLCAFLFVLPVLAGAGCGDETGGSTPGCGDSAIVDPETCDDGNVLACDGCEGCRLQRHLQVNSPGVVHSGGFPAWAADAFCPDCAATVEAWVRLDEVGSVYEALGTSCGFLSVHVSKGRFGLYRFPEPVCSGTTVVKPNVWYHVAAAMGWWKGAPMRLYVNGKLECSALANNAVSSGVAQEVLLIGAGAGGVGAGCVSQGQQPAWGKQWLGRIDEVRASAGLR